MKHIILALLLTATLFSDTKKGGHRGSDPISTPEATPDESEGYPVHGVVLRWRYTRPAGKVPNVGPYFRTIELAQQDAWKNAATKTNSVDEYSARGTVYGMVVKSHDPPIFQWEDDGDVVFQKEDPSKPAFKTKFRWVVKRLTVMAILYAEVHKPRYTYYTETDLKGEQELPKAPPNVPQNPPSE